MAARRRWHRRAGQAAVEAGAGVVHVAVGGSASTDGGAGAIRAIRRGSGLGGARLTPSSATCGHRSRTRRGCLPRRRAPTLGKSPAHPPAARAGAGLPARSARSADDGRGRRTGRAVGGVRGPASVPGASFVLDALEFDRRMRSSRAVIAEKKLDQQSLAGKAASEVATRARQAGVPCFAVVGRDDLDSFGLRILDLQAVLEAGTLAELERAGRDLVRLIWV